MNLLSLVPSWAVRWLVLAAAVLAFTAYGYFQGTAHKQAQWDAEKAAQAAATQKVLIRQGQVVEKVVTQYVDRVRMIKEKADVVIREVPVYVKETDCPAPAGERVLLDAAINGTAPKPTDVAAAEPIPAAALAQWQLTVIERYKLNAEGLSACWAFYDRLRQARGEVK
jgi:hypothetical protein